MYTVLLISPIFVPSLMPLTAYFALSAIAHHWQQYKSIPLSLIQKFHKKISLVLIGRLFLYLTNYPLCISSWHKPTNDQCLTTITFSRPTCVTLPHLWCKENAQLCVNTSMPTLCIPVVIITQVYLFEKEEVSFFLETVHTETFSFIC